MNRLAAGLLLALAVSVLPAAAQDDRDATLADVRGLKADLDRLDDSLGAVGSNDSRSREFQDRADRIRGDVVRLREEIQRNRRGQEDALGVPYSEVQRIRESIASLRRDVDRSIDGRAGVSAVDVRRGAEVRIPQGTEIAVRLEDRVSSETARPEDPIEATVDRSVRVDGRVVIPAGTRVRGTVRDAEAAQRVARGGRLELDFDTLQLDDGTRVDLRSRVVRMSESLDKGETGKRAGIGALLGGIVGGVLDGKKGALIGALVGGSGGVITSRGDDVVLPAGTTLTLALERPAVVASR